MGANQVFAVDGQGHSRNLYQGDEKIGRLAYVPRRGPKGDFYVLPFPDRHEIRAYRVNGSGK